MNKKVFIIIVKMIVLIDIIRAVIVYFAIPSFNIAASNITIAASM